MKHTVFFIFIQLIFTISSGSSADSKRFSFSLIGPYKVVFKQVYNCNPTKNNKIQHNLYVSHKANTTLLRGNSTFEVPFDDTFFLQMRMALKDSFGNWRENVYMHNAPNACSSLKKIMGNASTTFAHGLGFENSNCPALPGIYISPGLDPSFIKDSNMPKAFIYGTYKFHVYYTRTNEIFGCQVFILEIKRP